MRYDEFLKDVKDVVEHAFECKDGDFSIGRGACQHGAEFMRCP